MEAKPWYASKVLWTNIVLFLVSALELTEVINLIPPEHTGALAAIVAFANLVLRFLTTGPVVATREHARARNLRRRKADALLPVALLACVLGLSLPACAARAGVDDPPGGLAQGMTKAKQLAIRTQEVVQQLQAGVYAIGVADATLRPAAIQALEVTREIGLAGQDAAAAFALWDLQQAMDANRPPGESRANEATGLILQALSAMERRLPDVLEPFTHPDTQARIQTLVRAVERLIVEARQAVGTTPTPATPHSQE